MIYFIENIITLNPNKDGPNYLYVFFPLFGILIVILIKKYLIKQKLSYSIPGILEAISKQNGFISFKNLFAPAILSSITLGFGGSVGMEGPAVNNGAAIGSNTGRWMGLKYKHIILLIACGASGAIAGLFKAPIAGVLFSLEILMIDLSMASLLPLLIASVTGTLTSYFFLGTNVIYLVEHIENFKFADLPFFALLGIFCGLVSVYLSRILLLSDKFFIKIKNSYWKLIAGGTILGGLILIFPSLYGEGYHHINSCLNGKQDFIFNNSFFSGYQHNIIIIIILLFGIILFKAVATSITFSVGGVGGIFGPVLFLGAVSGYLFTSIITYFNISNLPQINFSLAGMTGLLAGVMHAPLTGIFLIAEITNGYNMMVPLIITASISYITVKYFFPYSVDAIQLAEKGELITHDKDKAVLTLMKIDKLIETNFLTVSPDNYLGELVKVIARSERNIFPVVDNENNLLGIVFLNDIRNVVFKQELYGKLIVRDLMFMPSPTVSPDESMEEIAKKFEKTDNYNIPVVNDGKYVGFVSRANVFSEYRKLLKQFSEE
jgi:CIC family chloride channel protein